MADFNPAVERIFEEEGGYVNDPDDPGGETNFGISKRSYPALNIRDLDKTTAKGIYYRDYWAPILGDGINSQEMAELVFDYAVNSGVKQAAKELQREINGQFVDLVGFPLRVDGALGPITLAALNRVTTDAVRAELILCRYALARIHFLKGRKNASKYLKGWVSRVLHYVL